MVRRFLGWPHSPRPLRLGGESSALRNGALPRKMSESFVRLGHAVRLLAGVHGLAFLLVGGHEFISEPLAHGTSCLGAAGVDQPSERQALLAALVDLHRDLVVGPANPS